MKKSEYLKIGKHDCPVEITDEFERFSKIMQTTPIFHDSPLLQSEYKSFEGYFTMLKNYQKDILRINGKKSKKERPWLKSLIQIRNNGQDKAVLHADNSCVPCRNEMALIHKDNRLAPEWADLPDACCPDFLMVQRRIIPGNEHNMYIDHWKIRHGGDVEAEIEESQSDLVVYRTMRCHCRGKICEKVRYPKVQTDVDQGLRPSSASKAGVLKSKCKQDYLYEPTGGKNITERFTTPVELLDTAQFNIKLLNRYMHGTEDGYEMEEQCRHEVEQEQDITELYFSHENVYSFEPTFESQRKTSCACRNTPVDSVLPEHVARPTSAPIIQTGPQNKKCVSKSNPGFDFGATIMVDSSVAVSLDENEDVRTIKRLIGSQRKSCCICKRPSTDGGEINIKPRSLSPSIIQTGIRCAPNGKCFSKSDPNLSINKINVFSSSLRKRKHRKDLCKKRLSSSQRNSRMTSRKSQRADTKVAQQRQSVQTIDNTATTSELDHSRSSLTQATAMRCPHTSRCRTKRNRSLSYISETTGESLEASLGESDHKSSRVVQSKISILESADPQNKNKVKCMCKSIRRASPGANQVINASEEDVPGKRYTYKPSIGSVRKSRCACRQIRLNGLPNPEISPIIDTLSVKDTLEKEHLGKSIVGSKRKSCCACGSTLPSGTAPIVQTGIRCPQKSIKNTDRSTVSANVIYDTHEENISEIPSDVSVLGLPINTYSADETATFKRTNSDILSQRGSPSVISAGKRSRQNYSSNNENIQNVDQIQNGNSLRNNEPDQVLRNQSPSNLRQKSSIVNQNNQLYGNESISEPRHDSPTKTQSEIQYTQNKNRSNENSRRVSLGTVQIVNASDDNIAEEVRTYKSHIGSLRMSCSACGKIVIEPEKKLLRSMPRDPKGIPKLQKENSNNIINDGISGAKTQIPSSFVGGSLEEVHSSSTNLGIDKRNDNQNKHERVSSDIEDTLRKSNLHDELSSVKSTADLRKGSYARSADNMNKSYDELSPETIPTTQRRKRCPGKDKCRYITNRRGRDSIAQSDNASGDSNIIEEASFVKSVSDGQIKLCSSDGKISSTRYKFSDILPSSSIPTVQTGKFCPARDKCQNYRSHGSVTHSEDSNPDEEASSIKCVADIQNKWCSEGKINLSKKSKSENRNRLSHKINLTKRSEFHPPESNPVIQAGNRGLGKEKCKCYTNRQSRASRQDASKEPYIDEDVKSVADLQNQPCSADEIHLSKKSKSDDQVSSERGSKVQTSKQYLGISNRPSRINSTNDVILLESSEFNYQLPPARHTPVQRAERCPGIDNCKYNRNRQNNASRSDASKGSNVSEDVDSVKYISDLQNKSCSTNEITVSDRSKGDDNTVPPESTTILQTGKHSFQKKKCYCSDLGAEHTSGGKIQHKTVLESQRKNTLGGFDSKSPPHVERTSKIQTVVDYPKINTGNSKSDLTDSKLRLGNASIRKSNDVRCRKFSVVDSQPKPLPTPENPTECGTVSGQRIPSIIQTGIGCAHTTIYNRNGEAGVSSVANSSTTSFHEGIGGPKPSATYKPLISSKRKSCCSCANKLMAENTSGEPIQPYISLIGSNKKSSCTSGNSPTDKLKDLTPIIEPQNETCSRRSKSPLDYNVVDGSLKIISEENVSAFNSEHATILLDKNTTQAGKISLKRGSLDDKVYPERLTGSTQPIENDSTISKTKFDSANRSKS